MRSWRWYSKVLFALLVAAFAYWVWPTPWHYLPAAQGEQDRGIVAIRLNRLTGRTRLVTAGFSAERPMPEPAASGQVTRGPRYQICFSPLVRADTFLLDTQTGEVMQLVEDPKTHGSLWELMSNRHLNVSAIANPFDDFMKGKRGP